MDGGEPPTVSRKVSVHSHLDRCEQEKLEMGLLQKARQEMGSLGCICLQGSPRHRAWGRGASYPKTLLIFLESSPWGQRVVSGNRGVVGAKTLEGKKKELTSCPLGHRLLPGTQWEAGCQGRWLRPEDRPSCLVVISVSCLVKPRHISRPAEDSADSQEVGQERATG